MKLRSLLIKVIVFGVVVGALLFDAKTGLVHNRVAMGLNPVGATSQPDKAGPPQATPDKAGPPQATPDKAGPPQATPDKAGPPQATPDKAGPPQATPDKAGPPQATPDKAGPPQATPDKSAASQSRVTYVTSGGINTVNVTNHADGKVEMKANVDYNRIHASHISADNYARAETSCTNCMSFAIALQIDLYKAGTTQVIPQNVAVATNYNCHNCTAFARAIQYAIPVDDVENPPEDVKNLTKEMDKELNEIDRLASKNQITVAEAASRIDQVIAQFQSLAPYLLDQQDQKED